MWVQLFIKQVTIYVSVWISKKHIVFLFLIIIAIKIIYHESLPFKNTFKNMRQF